MSTGGLSWILLSLGQVICFTSLSQIFVLTYSSSLAIARLHSYVKFAEPQNWASSPTSSLIKKNLDIKSNSFLIVDGVTIFEPFEQSVDNETIPQETLPNNIYQRIVHIMKQSTQEYYNMRMLLGFECK
jgi:hypothetical protein